MDLGTGIFLSTIVLAIVVLYGITKDRWNWRRLIKRTALACLGFVLLGAVGGGGVYLYNHMPVTVGTQREYAGIRLGMNQDEVLYIKGYPPTVLAEEVPEPKLKGFLLVLDTNKLEKGKSVRDYRHWSYKELSRSINIAFDEAAKVAAIQCYSEDKLGRCPAIAGIEDGNQEARVFRILGDTPHSEITGVTKSLTYRNLASG